MKSKALIIGNSDGIGLAVTKELLKLGWQVTGISRSNSKIDKPEYKHFIADVRDKEYTNILKSIITNDTQIDLCFYCVGIGELLDFSNMVKEIEIISVNLIGMISTAANVIPLMVKTGKGHFIGISSLADEMLSPQAPSYHSSKAGFSNYLEGLALALKSKGVYVTNIRFGFVDTKMAKGNVKPFMMNLEKAVKHIFNCISKKPVRYTAPLIVIPLIKLRKWMLRLSTWFR